MKTVRDILNTKVHLMISVEPDTTIYHALQVMAQHKLGSIIIAEDKKVMGIWTERDLLRNVMDDEFSIHTAKIKDYMSTGIQSIDIQASLNSLIDRFATLHNRHLLVTDEDTYVAVVSSGDAIRANLIERSEKYKELNTFLSWEYYEKWHK